MTMIDHAGELEHLFGPPGTLDTAATCDFDRCSDLVRLMLDGTTIRTVSREPWQSYATGVTLVVESESGLTLGLDFPAGEHAGPDGGWVRARPRRGAEHWRVGRRDAVSIWLLLKGAAAVRGEAAIGLRPALVGH
jgi:hypothetical protein